MLLPGEYVDFVRQDTAVLAEAARLNPERMVASCPEWTMTDLVTHAGTASRWFRAQVVNEDMSMPGLLTDPTPPDGADAAEWSKENIAALVASCESADAAAPAWTFVGPGTKLFWIRRAAHEYAVHRWDAEATVRAPRPIDALLATDGIDEILEVFTLIMPGPGAKAGTGQTLHLDATDHEAEWTVHFTPDGVQWSHRHERTDGALRGTASELLLFLWGRVDPPEPAGDPALIDLWRGAIRT